MISTKASKAEQMPTTIEHASQLVRSIAEPRTASDSVKAAISRAFRRLQALPDREADWSFNRVRDIWHGSRRARLWADEMRDLERAEKMRAAYIAQRQQEAGASNEYWNLIERLNTLEAALLATDADFYRETVSANRMASGGPRNMDRTLAEKAELKGE